VGFVLGDLHDGLGDGEALLVAIRLLLENRAVLLWFLTCFSGQVLDFKTFDLLGHVQTLHVRGYLLLLWFVRPLLNRYRLLFLLLLLLVGLRRSLALDQARLLAPDHTLLVVDGGLLDVVLDGGEGGLVGNVDAGVALGLTGLDADVHASLVDALVGVSASLGSAVAAGHGGGLVVGGAVVGGLTEVELVEVLGLVEVGGVVGVVGGLVGVRGALGVVVGFGEVGGDVERAVGGQRRALFALLRLLLGLRHVVLLWLDRLGLFQRRPEAARRVGEG